MKIIQRFIEVIHKIPKIITNSLVAFAESGDETNKSLAVLTVRLLALNNPLLCGWSGGIRLLVESAIDPSLNEISDSIVWTLLFILNEPKSRIET